MKLTNKQINGICNCFEQLLKIRLKTSLKYQIAFNETLLRPFKESLDRAKNGDDIEGVRDYFSNRQKIIDEFVIDGHWTEMGLEKITSLNNEYSDTIAQINQREIEYKELLAQVEDVGSIRRFKLDDFPDEIEIDISPILPFFEE